MTHKSVSPDCCSVLKVLNHGGLSQADARKAKQRVSELSQKVARVTDELAEEAPASISAIEEAKRVSLPILVSVRQCFKIMPTFFISHNPPGH